MAEVPNGDGIRAEGDGAFWAVPMLERTLGLFLATILFAMMSLTVVDVIGRYFFSHPLPAGHELTELLVGMIVYAGIPLIIARDQQITITLFKRHIRGLFLRLLAVLLPLFGAVVMAVFAWRLWVQAAKLADFGSATIYLEWPVYPFVYFMSVMAALSTVIYVALAWRRMKQGPTSATGFASGA